MLRPTLENFLIRSGWVRGVYLGTYLKEALYKFSLVEMNRTLTVMTTLEFELRNVQDEQTSLL